MRIQQGETETKTIDNITQARYNFVLAFQIFRRMSVGEQEDIHTGYCAIDLLDEALNLHPDFQEARALRGDIWHAILIKNFDENYNRYLNSKAWSEIRDKCFDKFGCLCPCGLTATQVHHKTYTNVGKENLRTDLVVLCDSCHDYFHKLRNSNGRVSDVKGKEYWDSFKTYMEENANELQLFPDPHGNSIYGIEIDGKTRKNNEIGNEGAIWLVAYRDRDKLQANLCMQSSTHYSLLKKQKNIIKGQFEGNLGELKCDDNGKRIGFHDNNVGDVAEADRDEEFPWLRDRLVKLHKVFQPLVLKL